MSADVCEVISFTCAMEENHLKRSEEFTNDRCQLPMLTWENGSSKQSIVMQLALLCSVLNFSIQDNNDASFKEIFPPHMLKQQEKMGLKHYVTKLTRLHYHLGFYVYATLLFFFLLLLIGYGMLSQGRLSCASLWHFSPGVNHWAAKYVSSGKREERKNVSSLEGNH